MNSLEDIVNHILYYGKKNKVTKKNISRAIHMANYFYKKNKNLKLIISKLPDWCSKR